MEQKRIGKYRSVTLYELDGRWTVTADNGDQRWLSRHWSLPVGGDLESVIREVTGVWDTNEVTASPPLIDWIGTTEKGFNRFVRISGATFIWFEDGSYVRRAISANGMRGFDEFVGEPSDAGLIASLLVEYLGKSPNSGISVKAKRVVGPDRAVDLDVGRTWLVARSDDPKRVAKALKLVDVSPTSWSDGLANCLQAGWFVSPVVDGWVLAVSPDLGEEVGFDDEETLVHFVKPLSRKLKGVVQVFHWDADAAGCVAVWADSGRLVRLAAHGWEGEGEVTPIETELFAAEGADPDEFEFPVGWLPRVAAAWGLDVTTLSQRGNMTSGWEATRRD